jgi:hypothetical protein
VIVPSGELKYFTHSNFKAMKNIAISFTIFLALVCQSMLCAQNTEWRPGGFWQGHTGIVMPRFQSLPGGAEAASSNWTLGGGGHGVLGHRFLLGGSGYSALKEQTGNALAVTSSFGMGFIDAGWILRVKGRAYHYVFAGVGGGGVSLRYDNNTEAPVTLADNLSVAPSERAKISSGGFAWQAGLSLNRLFFDPETKSGGLKIGLELGVFHFPWMSQWTNAGNDIALNGVARPSMYGGFLRLTVGAGGKR